MSATFASTSRRILSGLAKEAYQQVIETKSKVTGQIIMQWTLGIVISTPLIATIQGIVMLSEYRFNHANAPRPVMPTRGVIVVDDTKNDSSVLQQEKQIIETGIVGGSSISISSSSEESQKEQYLEKSLLPKGEKQQQWGLLSWIWNRQQQQKLQQPAEQQQQRPLRVLVIGDSLAAGVGMSKSGTPALPESIAVALSNSFGGKRVIHWTCIGRPGTCLSHIINEIHELEVEQKHHHHHTHNSSRVEQLVREWRLKRAKRRQDRQLEKQEEAEKEENKSVEQNKQHRIRQWWRHLTTHFREDMTDIKDVVVRHSTKKILDADDEANEKVNKAHKDEDDDDVWFLKKSLLNPQVVGEYDIAIVLTGLNDLKEGFMPVMMMSSTRSTTDEGEGNSAGGLRKELHRMLNAFQYKMDHKWNLELPPSASLELPTNQNKQGDLNHTRKEEEQQHQHTHASSEHTKSTIIDAISPAESKQMVQDAPSPTKTISSLSTKSLWNKGNDHQDGQGKQRMQPPSCTTLTTVHHQQQHHHRPLVVIPALPIAPLELFQRAPVKWFLKPAFAAMEENKRVVSERYPDSVLFVEQPSREFWTAVERQRKQRGQENNKMILYKLTDATKHAKERIQKLMKKHYHSNKTNDTSSSTVDSKSSSNAINECEINKDDKDNAGQNQNNDTSAIQQDSVRTNESTINKPVENDPSNHHNDHVDTDDIHVDHHHKDHPHRKHPHQSDHQQQGHNPTNSKKSALVAIDRMHPNDEGYDIWGRHIAAAIVTQWKALEEKRQSRQDVENVNKKSKES